jgi:hypothetical protein
MLGQAGPLTSSIDQRSGRANINTSATELATHFLKGQTKGSAYQSLAPSIGEGDGSGSPYLLADPDAAPTEDTEIIIPVEKGAVSLYRKIFIGIREVYLLNSNVISHLLQLTASILRAGDAALGYRYIAQADVQGTTAFPAVTSEAGVGVFSENELQDIAPQLLNLRCVGLDLHSISSRRSASRWQTPHPFDFHNTHATTSVRRQARMMA